MKFCVVGAGFSGAVIARALGEAGFDVVVIDERRHVAGNCYTERDAATGVQTHIYGPHIFHTANQKVWRYLNDFGEFVPYNHRVKAVVNGKVYTLPINLHTINQLFGLALRPQEARDLISAKADRISAPGNFEEQALSLVGRELYEAFFAGYTSKQWGRDPKTLPASILKRLPVRFNFDDSYFAHPYQAIPRNGYTDIVRSILDAPRVQLRLSTKFEEIGEEFDHVIYTGPLDRYFNFAFGRLAYRTLDFDVFRESGDYQGAAVVNFCDAEVPYTRVTEHKHFAPWESHEQTICYREYSRECGASDTPYYPVRLVDSESLLEKYVQHAKTRANVTFVGRLGTYRYLDMDQAIDEALQVSETLISCLREKAPMPVFLSSPK
jgi:UDP-galactopyranose mutase